MDQPLKHEQSLDDVLDVLMECSQIIYKMHQSTKKNKKLPKKDSILEIPLMTCCNTSLAIYKLLKNDTRTDHEAFMLMRALLEKIVNFHYLRVADESEVDRYFMHAWYRMYHSMNMQEVGTSQSFYVPFDSRQREALNKDDRVKEALEMFSKTKPGMDWTDKSFKKRIKIISERSSMKESHFLATTLIVYSDASEVLHATFYGEVFLTGLLSPRIYGVGHVPNKVLGSYVSRMLRNPLASICLLLVETIEMLADDYGAVDYKKQAGELRKRARKSLATNPDPLK